MRIYASRRPKRKPPVKTGDGLAAEETLRQYNAGELEDWEEVREQLLTASDRFMQGLVVGILLGVGSFGLAVALLSVIP